MAHRSWLFVPGDSDAKLAKIAACGADAVIIDLEDSVAENRKQMAREATKHFLQNWHGGPNTPALYVRVNGLSTGLINDDLAVAISASTMGIMLPKAEGGISVTELSALMRVAEAHAGLADGKTKIIAIATETATGVLNAGTYANCSPRLVALAWGTEDLSADIGAHSARDATGSFTPLFTYARTMLLLGASAAGVAAIDGIYADFRDENGLAVECAEAYRDGFSGKMAIHPAQIPIINDNFSPSQAAIIYARKIVDTFAMAGTAGVISLDGRMLDAPHLKLAKRILAQGKVE
jgi:citrate lyase subunit beta / citryl-CoA lyase